MLHGPDCTCTILSGLLGLNTTFSVKHKMAMRFFLQGMLRVFILGREMPLSPGNLCSYVDRVPSKDMNKP